MSQAIKIAVCARFVNDASPEGTTALPGLLAKNPLDSTLPAIFNGTKADNPPVYDCLTYRLTQATPDNRFQPAQPLLAPGQPPVIYTEGVENFFLDLEAWTQTEDSAPLDAINLRLDALFHHQAFDTSAGRVFRAERIMRETDLYDKVLEAWFSLSRYRLRFQASS